MPNLAKFQYLFPTDYNLQNHICVLPCGSLDDREETNWSADHLEPYVSYILEGQKIDQLFRGFIFNAIRTRKDHYIYPLYVGFGKPADKTDWEEWLTALFAPTKNLSALHHALQQPNHQAVDVWIALPYPHPFQSHFGVIGTKRLNFKEKVDRIEAVKWWMDQFTNRWEREVHLHDKLQFRGFLWQREAIDPYDQPVVKAVNQFIHQKNLYAMWLPNYGSYGVIDWKDLGFHVAAINSNYYGNTSYDYTWINHASTFARTYQTGLQINFGKGLIYNETHHLDYFNLGLPDMNHYMNRALLVYQFPNQTVKEIYENHFVDYIRLYTFIKGLYTKVSYPGIPY